MNKLVAILFLTVGGLVYACGGMTHVTSPSMQIKADENCSDIESVVDHLQPIVVMC